MQNNVTLKKSGLEIPLKSGEKAYFNYFWLRDNCATSWDADTQERVFDILTQDDDLAANDAYIDADVLNVTWPCGHQSRYDLDWLARWHAGVGHGDIAIRSRRSWYSDHYDKMARFRFDDLIAQPARVADWAESMLDEGVALLTDMPNSNEALEQACELLGTVRPSFSGYNFDVQSKKNPENLAYTSKALELHTDLPPEELAPGIQFLHCRQNDAEGGDSLFVDATSVANALREEYPAYFALLTEVSIPFRYTTLRQDVRARQHVIEIDKNNGEVSGINYSQHLSDVFDLSQSLLDEFYPAFRTFGLMLQDPKYLMQFRLNAGECIVFDNHRIAHGRAAFQAGSGARHLRGCYVDRGEMRSTYRVLRSQFPV